MSNILEALKIRVSEINVELDPDNVPTDVALLKAGIIDSFGFVELVVFVEQHFDLSLDDDELNDSNFASLSALENFIR
ncbi:MAG: acyl carrier protein, partial [Pseudomonadota bacterium]|nr:acyl carrier protein [Pseudomonadota bacterium]